MMSWGSDQTTPHMSVAWSWAFDTPFKWTKQVASFFGGTRQGMAISWPGHIKDVGGIRTQFHHVIDIVPTILEATGIHGARDGQWHQAEADRRREHGLHLRQREREGAIEARHPVFRDVRQPRHLSRWLDRRHGSSATPVAHGHGQNARRLTGYKWELYNIAEDYSENNDLAAKNPDKLKELQDLFMVEAKKYQVLPLDNSILERILTPRPSATAGRTEFTYSGECPACPSAARPTC